MSLTSQIADYVSESQYTTLPDEVLEKAKLCLMDWLAVTLAGSHEPVCKSLVEVCKLTGGYRQATLVGWNTKASILQAALINGTAAHALDYDDVHPREPGHPSAPVIPAILAVSEWRKLSGEEFITSLIVGIQVMFSIGSGIMPYHYEGGWHNTGTMGHFGAAAAACKLLNLNSSQITNALGIAGTQASGLKKVFGTMCKPLHAGKAAMDGLLSALLAEKGFTSSKDILEGKDGFFTVASSKADPQKVISRLQGGYVIDELSFKLYPSCYSTHGVIECILALKEKYQIAPRNIKEIVCTVHPRCLDVAAIPKPCTPLEGKFSVQYCAALALTEEKVSIDSFVEPKLKDPTILQLQEKINLEHAPSYTEERRARVVIRTFNGEKYKENVAVANLLQDKEKARKAVIEKFKRVCSLFMGMKKINKIIKAIDSLHEMKDMSQLINIFSS